jgi:hypothetical protein
MRSTHLAPRTFLDPLDTDSQLDFPERPLKLKASSEAEAEKWEAELNRAHMLKVNGPASSPKAGSKGIVLVDSPKVIHHQVV